MTSKKIMTVCGPIAAEAAGITLIHEHLNFDARCLCHSSAIDESDHLADEAITIGKLGKLRRNPLSMADNLVVDDVDLLVEAVAPFRAMGGGTIVDVTPQDIGRDPSLLKAVSERSGVHVVAGSTHYVQAAHPAFVEGETVEQIAERMLGEVTEGIAGSGIKPGILGEIGTSNPIHPSEVKVLQAAARVSARTGIAITLHMDPTAQAALEVLDILEAAGADPGRVVVGHLDMAINREDVLDGGDPTRYIRQVMDRGAYVALDTFGEENWYGGGITADGPSFMCPSDQLRVHAVLKLIEQGRSKQLLISQDVCMKMTHQRYGGFGYSYILEYIVPELMLRGIPRSEIDQILVENSRDVLAY